MLFVAPPPGLRGILAPFLAIGHPALERSRSVLSGVLQSSVLVEGNIARALEVALDRSSNVHALLVAAGVSEAVLCTAAGAFDELRSDIDTRGSGKLAALAVEAVAAERVLENLSEPLHAAAACLRVAKELPDALLLAIAHHLSVGLAERCRDAEQLSAIPAEPSTFFVTAPTGAHGLGSLCAPHSLFAGDLSFRSPALARPNRPLYAQFALQREYSTRCAGEAPAALAWFGTRATVSVKLAGVALPSQLSIRAAEGLVDVYADVPACALP